MWSRSFWRDAGERALSTALETLLAVLGLSSISGAVDPGALLAVSWPTALATAGAAGLLSLVKAVIAVTSGIGEPGTASLVGSTGRHARREP